jgi:NAD(P)-dependent dehydrogenase (short-subunit alcohol dehydrogenase family)
MAPNRNVLVTGSSTGIGEACALHLDRLGWHVFAGVRRPEDGERLRAQASERLTPVELDVADESQVGRALAAIDEIVGDDGLAGLVNNAGISRAGPIELLPLEQWREQFEVNVFGQVAVTKASLPLIRRSTGRIVFMSSISGRSAPGFLGPYAASKYALEAIGASLREELLPWGIRVAMVEPGVIVTPIWSKGPTDEELRAMMGAEGLRLYQLDPGAVRTAVDELVKRGVPASTVADVVEHALTASRPRYRYLVGRDAKLIGAFARFAPDRVFARIRRRL